MMCISFFALVVPLAGCSGGSGAADAGPAGGPVDGGAQNAAALDHCQAPDGGSVFQPVSAADCHPDAGDAGSGSDADDDYGATMYGTAGYDDDCKYHVTWSSTPIRENTDVTFTVNVTYAASQKAATGGDVGNSTYIEAYLNDTHPADTGHATSTETSPGVYSIGPVQFDSPGIWTVRFHVFGDCEDLSPASPHGHAAFFVSVP